MILQLGYTRSISISISIKLHLMRGFLWHLSIWVVMLWFQDCESIRVFLVWESFIEALLTRFGSSAYEDPMEALMRLRQTSNVVAYKGQFEALSNGIKCLSENHKLSSFLSGLKDDVRLPMKMLNPRILMKPLDWLKFKKST